MVSVFVIGPLYSPLEMHCSSRRGTAARLRFRSKRNRIPRRLAPTPPENRFPRRDATRHGLSILPARHPASSSSRIVRFQCLLRRVGPQFMRLISPRCALPRIRPDPAWSIWCRVHKIQFQADLVAGFRRYHCYDFSLISRYT